MKSKFLSSITLLFVSGTGLFAQTSGGPDTYGYTWKNQAAVGGPVYTWKEIKGTGTQITGLGDDNSVGTFNMNWNFHYYWNDYNKALIGSNGWMSFTSVGNIASPFPTIPSSVAPNNFIACMLSDLTFTAANSTIVPGASAWYWTNNVDTFIVQWDSIPFWTSVNPGWAGRNTFQIILSGADSSITFQYKYQNQGTPAYNMAAWGLKSGIENQTGQIGLPVLNNLFPTALTAVKFDYPFPVTYQVFDVTPGWNQNSANGGFFVSGPYGAPLSLQTDIVNTGNQPVGAISVAGQILDSVSAQVWSGSTSVVSLIAGADSIKTYSNPYYANVPGNFTYRNTTTLAGDMNPGNNITDVEMVIADTTLPIIPLSFVKALPSAIGLVNWSGGGSTTGGGVYIIPPFYPATVVSLDYFIATGTTGGFISTVLDDDGTGSAPGTVLFADTLLTSVLGAFTNVPLAIPVTVTSGGIYVGMFMSPDTTAALGTDLDPPYSDRNYEILGGSWAPYRSNSAGDMMIKVNIQGSNTVGTHDLNEGSFSLSQNFPNPSGQFTTIHFALPSSGDVQFTLRNLLGATVESISLGQQTSGTHGIKINTSKFAPGIYFYSIKSGDKEMTRKMVVSR